MSEQFKHKTSPQMELKGEKKDTFLWIMNSYNKWHGDHK